MKKVILIILVLVLTRSIQAQQHVFIGEQTLSYKDKTIESLSRVRYGYFVNNIITIGPYISTNGKSLTGLAVISIESEDLSLGLGAGGTKDHRLLPRISEWLAYSYSLEGGRHLREGSSIKLLTWGELGVGGDSYFYDSSLSYENKSISAGILCRRFLGLGPSFGYKVNLGNDWIFTPSISGTYDLEENHIKAGLSLKVSY